MNSPGPSREPQHYRSSSSVGEPAKSESVFRKGENIWRLARAERISFLIDANAFYTAFVDAALLAREQIFVVGWDTDSRTELPAPPNCPEHYLTAEGKLELGHFLAALTRERPELRVHILTWDFAFIYLFEREALPSLKFSALDSDRLHFVLDREHPALASHHQKIVVIDDAVAFSGGLDITQRRWDTPEHRGNDPRRVDPGGHKYGPFHDVQICVDGSAARSLGEIARERWRIATGDEVAPPQEPGHFWPKSAEVAIRSIDVGIARTLPLGYSSQMYGHEPTEPPSPAVDEVEKLFLASIARAKRFVYIENQYFTSPVIAEAIARRLREPDGPEFVMVLPRDQTGWIEESTMGLLRSHALKVARDADLYGRFRCYYPVVPNLEQGYVKVHSKVMVVDDEFARVGSANLNNRSMGVDTECDLAMEAHGREDAIQAMADLRRSLLGEHLGVDPQVFEARFRASRSLVKTVESFLGGPRTLITMESHIPDWVEKIAPPLDWIDPNAPGSIRRWFRTKLGRHPLLWPAVGVLVLTLFGRFVLGLTPQDFINAPAAVLTWIKSWDADRISAGLESIKGQPWTLPVILAGFIVGSLCFVPITAMILGVALSFSHGQALVIAMTGTILAALTSYGIGRYWAFTKSRFLSKPWVRYASEQLCRGGVWTVAAVRLMPIAPFTVVNVVSGGLRIPMKNFVMGTFIGLLPGISAITFLSHSATSYIRAGNWQMVLTLVIAVTIFFVALPYFWQFLRRLKRA